MKTLFGVIMAIVGTMAYADTPTITDVTAQQRYPWNGKVDISYTVTGIEPKKNALWTSFKVTAIDMVANTTNVATQLSGDLSKVMSSGTQVGETLTATFFVEPANPAFSPVDGTTFTSSLSVSMSCSTEGATIHYTTDGSEPTAESSAYKRFKIYGKTTVKAVAEKSGMLSEIVVAGHSLGRIDRPYFDYLTDYFRC